MAASPEQESRQQTDQGPGRVLVTLLNLAVSIHVTWFYVAFVPSALNLIQYEQGQERTPFQQRLLMMFPLHWAHQSDALNQLAHRLTAMPAWFPGGVRPEGIVEAIVDLACIITTGIIARKLYDAASPRRLLSAYVYPLTLLMIAATYCFNTMHRLRFVFDLPGMAFFSLGMYLIYFRRSSLLFAVLFVVATINRETTLFLLFLFALKQWADARQNSSHRATIWRRAFGLRTICLLASLSIFWVLWHLSIDRHFSTNISAAGPRFWLNIGTVLWPTSWAQILCAFAFCAPLCIAGRNLVHDRALRIWFWILPLWFLFMLRFGILIEIRIFGELIPYLACTAAIIAEQRLLHRTANQGEQSPAT